MKLNWPSFGLLLLAACSPPASDNYAQRVTLDRATRTSISEPLPSPDTEGAVWAEAREADRLLYGKPGDTPLLALACQREGVTSHLRLTRLAHAPEGAEALIAMIGNGYIARWPMDATRAGTAFVWQGDVALDNPKIEVLTGGRAVEATLPGTGTVKLNASSRPRELIERCKRFNSPELLDEDETQRPVR